MFRTKNKWCTVELEWLKENQTDLPISELAAMLGRGVSTIKKKIKELNGEEIPGKKNKISYIGKRKDLGGLFLRSRWEANVLRWLQYHKIRFMYEPQVFFFEGIKRGTVSYLPDIYLPDSDQFIEVKGQLTPKGRTAVNRFKKFFPGEFKKLVAITGSANTKASEFFNNLGVPILAYYNDINKEFKDVIPHWE